MGRTFLPYSQEVEGLKAEFVKFRRGLRADDQQAFDALFDQAQRHIQAAVYFADPDVAVAFFLSVLLEHWKMVDRLERKVADLEARFEQQSSRLA